MTLVVDASAAVAALVDEGSDGTWARHLLSGDALVGPHLLPVEVADVLRRGAAAGALPDAAATLAHADLLELRVELAPYGDLGERVWSLRGAVRPYDAWYVALAEALDAPLVTLDRRLARAPGPRCRFLLPPVPGAA